MMNGQTEILIETKLILHWSSTLHSKLKVAQKLSNRFQNIFLEGSDTPSDYHTCRGEGLGGGGTKDICYILTYLKTGNILRW